MQIDSTTHVSLNHSSRNGAPITSCVVHSCEGKLPSPRVSSLPWLCNPQPAHPEQRVSCHYYVCRNGEIYQLVPDDRAAWHAGVALATYTNERSIGVELEHRAGMNYPPAQKDALAWLLRRLMDAHHIDAAQIDTHGQIAIKGPYDRKHDPSDWPRDSFRAFVAALAPTKVPAPAMPVPTMPPTPPITADALLLSSPRTSQARCVAYLIRRPTGGYTPADVARIVALYHAQSCGIDPLLAIAQMIHETGHLTSYWAQRPRRNPCGFSVTGRTSKTKPATGLWERRGDEWHEGAVFASWELACRAHIGRLLAYALRDENATPSQRQLIARALAIRPLPAHFRGVAARLNGLNGRWAVPGTAYAERIAEIATAIRGQP